MVSSFKEAYLKLKGERQEEEVEFLKKLCQSLHMLRVVQTVPLS